MDAQREVAMKLFRATTGCFVEKDGHYFGIDGSTWDQILSHDDLEGHLQSLIADGASRTSFRTGDLLAPIQGQEVWAAGVTYYRSRGARMEESKDAGGGNFYDRVYSAERPELFFKSTASRTVGTGGTVRIRSDAKWSVPEPELTLMVSPGGRINGYTIGNDMSSRDIEGENPLYLPQAKVYDGSCAIGPGILVTSEPLSPSTGIQIEIRRGGKTAFAGATALSEMKRDFRTLVDYLYRETSFPDGCLLMTGTGVVPPDDFTLNHSDEISISIDAIGTLTNSVV